MSGAKVFGQILQTLRSQENSLYKFAGLVQHANKSTRRRHGDFLKVPDPIPYAGNFPRREELVYEEPSAQDIIGKVNKEIRSDTLSRLFAVVHIAGKQFKITTEDIIMIQGLWAPDVGDRVRFEKVLLAGSPSFTLVGRPLLPKDLVKIEATVIEKTLSYTQLFFILKKRENYRRLKFHKTPLSMVRINSIDVVGQVDEFNEVEGLRPNVVL